MEKDELKMLEMLGVILTAPIAAVISLFIFPVAMISGLLLGETGFVADTLNELFYSIIGVIEILLNPSLW